MADSSHSVRSSAALTWSQGSQAQLDFLLTFLPVLFFQTDGQGRFLEVKGALSGKLNIEPHAWQGMSYQEVCTGHPAIQQSIKRGLRGETFQHRWQSDTGQLIEGGVIPFVNGSGDIEGLMGFALEVKSQPDNWRKELAPDSLLRYFIRHAPAAVAMFDRDLRYLMVSEQWLEAYGVDEEVIGHTHYEVFPEVPDRWRKVHQRCLQGVMESCEADPFARLDGSIDYVDWVVAPWYTEDNEVGGLIFYTKIVNEQVEDRQRLLQLNQQLQRTNQRLEDFALAVSHTLRDPLSQAIAHGQRLLLRLESEATPATQQEAEDWLNHLHRLEKIIAGLLDNAHLGQHAAHRRVDLNQVIEEVRANLKPLLDSRQTHLLYGTLPEIKGNEFEMVALLQQLIANAVEYNDADAVEVILSSERLGGRGWQFCVRDNGVGLTAEQQGQLFSFARQLDVSRPRTLGIGLPVCKRIVEHLGGQMWVESEPGQGSAFYFTVLDERAE